MRSFFFATLLALSFFRCHAQTGDSTGRHVQLSLLTGISAGRYLAADIGFSINSWNRNYRRTGRQAFFFGYSLSSEFLTTPHKLVIGPKAGAWMEGSGASVIGANMIYYTDLDDGVLVFRPEVGLGAMQLKLVYGYNARLASTGFNRFSRHLVALTWCWKLKTLR